MRIYNIIIVFHIVSFFILGCAASNKINANQGSSNTNYRKCDIEALNQYAKEYQLFFSHENTFVLYLKNKTSEMSPNALTEFFVYRQEDQRIVYEDKIAGADISWKSDTELWIKVQKGIITSTSDTGKTVYILDLRTNKRSEYINKSNK